MYNKIGKMENIIPLKLPINPINQRCEYNLRILSCVFQLVQQTNDSIKCESNKWQLYRII